MEEKILLIGKLIQEGIEGEAEALKDYNREFAAETPSGLKNSINGRFDTL